MFWRIISALIVGFWAVMAGLLVRDTYFPEESRFAAVPPRRVLDLFLDHHRLLSALHLFHEKDRVGHASFSVRLRERDPEVPRQTYDLQATGLIEERARNTGAGNISWQMALDLLEGERPVALTLRVNLDASRTSVLVLWKEGDARPFFEVRNSGVLAADSNSMAAMMPMLGALGGLPAGTNTVSVTAREGLMELAGRQRRCYVLRLSMTEAYQIKAVFTQAGELARVDLPQGFHLLEPMMHGLGVGTAAEGAKP